MYNFVVTLEKTTQDLLRIASLSTHERNLADYIFTTLVVMGLKPVKQAGNIVVNIKGQDRTKAVIFDSHMDTISPGALSRWNYPPYGKDSGIKNGDKIYGLGASDNKCSISVLMNLAKELNEAKTIPPIDVWCIFVTEEETGGLGTQRFLSWFEKSGYMTMYKEISAVVCEATNMKEICLGHRGNFNAVITTKGKSGHGSDPHHIKDQAIFETIDLIHTLEALEKKWIASYTDEVLGSPSIAVTSINGGEFISPNKFPDSCAITIDVRTTKKLDKIAFTAIEKAIAKYDADIKIMYNPAPPGYTSPTEKIAQVGKKLTGKIVIGRTSTDLCFFSERNIPGIILGPGTLDAVHKPDEYCEISKMKKGLEMYSKIIKLLA